MSLQEQLKDEDECIAHHQKAINAAVGRRDKVRAEIAEAEKPKLRHGASFHDGCNPIVAITDGVKWKAVYPSECSIEYGSAEELLSMIEGIGYKLTGNIFDDLKALQGTLSHFEIDRKRVSLVGDGYRMQDKMSGHNIYISETRIDEFIMGLRQMRATQKRKAAH